MYINNISITREILKSEQEKLKKIREIQKMEPIRKNLNNNSEQEKEKRKGYSTFQEIYERELKRVKKLEE